MVTTDVELELRQQLKEAGRQLSNPPDSVDELLHVLDQTEKLLTLVDQSPNSLMQEALDPPMKALVDDSLLKHSNMDVKVSVAACICEITRITAPEAPYNDEEMKGVFQLIVSSFEKLSDESSRSYGKRLAILETVCKVRSCVIMLDLECDDLIVEMFEHFLKSVRDHHLERAFLLMTNIMALVVEESEDISVGMLKPLLASIKNNNEGVLPVARKLAEEVIKKSADKLRPYLKQTLKFLGDSLDNYSRVLTSVCEGTTDVVEHNDESTVVPPKAGETKLAPSTDDAAQVMSNGKIVPEKEEGLEDKESKKLEEAIDHPGDDPTNSVAEKPANTETKPESTSNREEMKSAEPTDSSRGDAEKSTDIPVTDQKEIESKAADQQTGAENVESESQSKSLITKGIRSKKKNPGQKAAPSTVVVLTKAPEGMSDSEMRSPKRAKKKTPKAEDNKPSATSGSDVEPLKKASEGMSDSEMKSPKRARKKTPKAQDNKPTPTSGSDLEPLKKASEVMSDSELRSPKRSRKKTQKAEDNKPSVTSGSDVEPVKKSSKVHAADSVPKLGKSSGTKVVGADPVATSGSDTELLKKSSKKVDTVDSGSKPVKRSGKKKVGGEYSVAAGGSDAELLQKSSKKVNTVDSESKLLKTPGKKVGAKGSVAKKAKVSGKKTDGGESKSKSKSKQGGNKVDAGESEVKPSKQSDEKENKSDSEDKSLKEPDEKEKSKVITKDEGSDSGDKTPSLSANDDEETDSDDMLIKTSVKKGNISSVISAIKKKPGKKLGHIKNVEEKDQAKSESDDDGMDLPISTVLKKATKGEDKLKEALSTSSKRKRSVSKPKVKETVKYDGSLIGQKVKVWWPEDKMFYEGAIESFDADTNKHEVLYLDGEKEYLILENERWEKIDEYSPPKEEEGPEIAIGSTNNVPETLKASTSKKPKKAAKSAGKSKGSSIKSKAVNLKKSKADEDGTDSQEPQKIVYKSKGRKKNTGVTETKADVNKSSELKSTSETVEEEVKDGDAAEEPESVKEKSTGTPKIGSMSGNKRKKT